MNAFRVLVTGGAGFVGANLAVALASRCPEWEIVALDNLRRRGSELNVPRLADAGVRFVRADVREPSELLTLERIDALVECSAEPSVLGAAGDTAYAVQTNLLGAFNCLELARRDGAHLVFLSTSRVYPVGKLNSLRLDEGETRFELAAEQPYEGASPAGISERFPLDGPRTLYGATKLAAEHLIEEYAEGFGLRTTVNRCGVIAGPWQMGKVDQGVFTYWMLAHVLGRELAYLGYGGAGKQVRDLLHVEDLVDLVEEQIAQPERWSGVMANVGGGCEISLSLCETTELCREITGNEVPIRGEQTSRPGDVPVFLSDCELLYERTNWRPQRGTRQVLEDIFGWIREHERALEATLG